jgi:hypothetical protein
MYSNECIVMNVHTLMRDGSDGVAMSRQAKQMKRSKSLLYENNLWRVCVSEG